MNAAHNTHSDAPDYGVYEKNFNIYLLGIFLCVLLTLVPYFAVKFSHYSYLKNMVHIYIAAIAQFIIQVLCFLRLNFSTEQAKMNSMSFIFSIVIVMVLVFGSLWIMWNLNYFMMC